MDMQKTILHIEEWGRLQKSVADGQDNVVVVWVVVVEHNQHSGIH